MAKRNSKVRKPSIKASPFALDKDRRFDLELAMHARGTAKHLTSTRSMKSSFTSTEMRPTHELSWGILFETNTYSDGSYHKSNANLALISEHSYDSDEMVEMQWNQNESANSAQVKPAMVVWTEKSKFIACWLVGSLAGYLVENHTLRAAHCLESPSTPSITGLLLTKTKTP